MATKVLADTKEHLLVVTVAKKEKREGLFKYIDDPKNAEHVIDRSPSKRLIDSQLFDEYQSKIDSYKHARISLISQNDDGSYQSLVMDAKPGSDEYYSILRRLRF